MIIRLKFNRKIFKILLGVLRYLESKEKIENTESTIRGYKLAEQSEKIINNRSLFISSLLNLENN